MNLEYAFNFLFAYLKVNSFIIIAPSAPTDITLIKIASSYAIISWFPPEFPNGIIQDYIVSLTGRSGELLSNISTIEMSVNITNLSPFMPYWVVVFAETVEIGEGSANFSFRTLEAGKLS